MPTRDYLDFELNIEAETGGKVRVTVANSPVGSVSVDSVNPFTDEEITRVVAILGGALPVTRSEAARTARAFGEKLFSAIFSGQIYAAYLASLNQAREGGLRIRLCLDKAGPLEDLPWELLRDPSGDYLALSRQTPVIRYPRLLSTRPLVEVSLPLRVLVLISSPTDQEPLDVEAEWRELEQATEDLRRRGLLELVRVDNAQLLTLQRKLREGTAYQVFHYIGHASFDDRTHQGTLAFEDPRTDSTVSVSGEGLARELVEENSIRLVVLNACQGARRDPSDPYAGIASSIVARGVPAVVAMQFPISDQASRVFSAEFYRAISEGYPIEAAVAEARRAIASTVGNLEWATPVLNLRSASGILFPKRRGATGTRTGTRGGLREALLRPPILLGAILLIGIIAFLLVSLARSAPPVPNGPTITPTVDRARDVNLRVVSMRFLPSNPAPGELVSVAIKIENFGTEDSGPFKWAWFAEDPAQNPEPTLQGEVPNLRAGLDIFVRGEYRFPWWGRILTTAWVNFDLAAPDKNLFDNLLRVREFTTNNDPFAVDFSVLPDGSLLESTTLIGDELAAWNIAMSLEPPLPLDCATANLQLIVTDDEGPELTSGLTNVLSNLPSGPATAESPGTPDSSAACDNLPIAFTLGQPATGPSIRAVRIDFVGDQAGNYVLELRDATNRIVNTSQASLSEPGRGTVEVRAREGAFNGARVVFRVPTGARTSIRRLIMALE